MFDIKKATIEDSKLINKAALEVFPETYKDILSKDQIDFMMDWMYSVKHLQEEIRTEHQIYFLAYEECEVAGYIAIRKENDDVIFLEKIYVLPYFQGYGLGKQMFEFLEKEIKQIFPEAKKMQLNVNRYNKALHFYEKMGMYEIGQRDFDIGNGYFMNDYILEKKLQ